MCGRALWLCAFAGRLNHPPTLSRGLRYFTIHSPAVNSGLTIWIRRRRIGYAPTSLPSIPMATRMLNSTKATNGEKRHSVDEANHHDHNHSDSRNCTTTAHNHTPDHDHDHENHDHGHSHSHSHGIFSAFGHTHSREDTSTAGAEKIVEALKGGSASCQCFIGVLGADMALFRRRPRNSNYACRIIRKYRTYRCEGRSWMVYGICADYMRAHTDPNLVSC